jgi:hypothetical protein
MHTLSQEWGQCQMTGKRLKTHFLVVGSSSRKSSRLHLAVALICKRTINIEKDPSTEFHAWSMIMETSTHLTIASLFTILIALVTPLSAANAEATDRSIVRQMRTHEPVDITFAGSVAYLSSGHRGVLVYDLNEPWPLTPKGTWMPETGLVQSVTLDGTRAFASVTGQCRGSGDGLVILDISNPWAPLRLAAFNPQLIDPWDDPEGCGIWSLPAYQSVVVGNWVYLATLGYGVYGLEVRDVKTTPDLRFHLDDIGSVWGLAYDGGFLYVACSSGLFVYDVRNPRNPVLAYQHKTLGAAISLVLDNKRLYLVDDGYGLLIFDRTSARRPVLLGTAPDTGLSAYNIAARDGFVYLADFLQGFLIIDARTPEWPRVVGSLTDIQPWDLVLAGNRSYVAASDHELVSVDISDPLMPKIIAQSRRQRP